MLANEQNQPAYALLKRHRRAAWAITACFFFGAAASAGILYALSGNAEAFLIAVPILLNYIFVIQRHHERALPQMLRECPCSAYPQPTLSPNDAHTKHAVSAQFELQYAVFLSILIALLNILAVPIVLWLEKRRKRNVPQSTSEYLRLKTEQSCSNFGCLGWLGCAGAVGCMLFQALLGFVAVGRAASANSRARMVHNAVLAWQEEMAELDKEITLQTEIYHIYDGLTPDEASVAYNIYRYFPNHGDYWCAIVCDDEGKILYTFFSNEEITEDELTPMTTEQQKKIEANLFTRGEVVGWYTPS